MPLPALLQDLRMPIIAAPMFIVSGVDLVVAECEAGIVGTFPALNARPAEACEEWLVQIERRLAGRKLPFAVNLVCHPTNDRLSGDLAVCARHRVPLLVTFSPPSSLEPPVEAVRTAHSYGGLIFHDVTTAQHARNAIAAGVDGLILICAGAGGHAGKISPFALLSEIRGFYDGPIALAGAITTGSAILAARAMGADLVYMGTRFIATEESNATEAYKQMIVGAASKDIIYASLSVGAHTNMLRPSLVAAGLDPDNMPPPYDQGGYVASHRRERPKAWKNIWGAGHGVGAIDDIPSVADCVAHLARDYDAAWARMQGLRVREPEPA
jgi:nitronate monooxygenase